MNRIYRLVWNHTLRVTQVASEFAASPHGGESSVEGPSVSHQRFLVLACAAALGLGIVPLSYAQTTGTAGTDGTNATTAAAATNGAAGGDALSLGSGDTLTISSSVTGGGGGAGGSAPNDLFIPQGTTNVVAYYTGSHTSGGNGGNGGAGISGSGFTLTNDSAITGGTGGYGGGAFMNASTLWDTDVHPTSTSVSLAGGMGGTGGAGVSGTGFTLTNNGTIQGGAAGVGGSAGYRSYVFASGSLVSYASSDRLPASSIAAASGGAGTGGVGVSGADFTLVNNGTLAGGAGFSGRGAYGSYSGGTEADGPVGSAVAASTTGGAGGAGVSGYGFTLTNNDVIVGGDGSTGNNASTFTGLIESPLTGGVSLVGVVIAGTVGGSGGAGISVSSSTQAQESAITNNAGASVAGGTGGQGGGYSPAENTDGAVGGAGGAGMTGRYFTLGNSGQVSGGSGGRGQVALAHDSNIGYGNGTYTINQHTGVGAIGGTGGTGGAGGAGVGGSSFTVVNSYAISGGMGGQGGYGQGEVSSSTVFASDTGGTGGYGGVGVGGSGFTLTNQADATLTGGPGGSGGNGAYASDSGGQGGAGGAGVSGSGFTLTNNGTITGGQGGQAGLAGTSPSYRDQATGSYIATSVSGGVNGSTGLGGAGVVATGDATIVNAGNISGGVSGDGQVQADAVDLSGGGNTLTLEAGYRFTGNVVSTSGTAQGGDTLALGGSTDGSFDVSQVAATAPTSYTGTPQFYGFTTYEKTGSSTWRLTGTYAAPIDWVVEQGTLDLSGITGGLAIQSLSGTGGSLSLGSNTLALDTAGTDTYAGTLTGQGLTMQGTGTQILDGQATLTGTTTVTRGVLEIGDADTPTATLTDPQVDVQGTGTLRGHGTLIGDVSNEGIVRPGGSVGVLTVQGNYTQAADGTLTLDVTPTQASELKVDGQASLAGTLNLVYAPGTYTKHTYTLVQADALTGRFATTTTAGTAPAALLPDVVYSPTAVYLALTTIHPADGALYGNLQRDANLADQQTLGTVLNVALDSADGSTASPSSVARDARQPGLWVQASGSNLSLDGSPGLDGTGFGLLGGFDAAVAGSLHVGVEAGVNQLNAHDALGGNGRIQSAHAGLYAFAKAGPLVISATVDGQHQRDRISRVTGIGQAASSPAGHALTGGVQVAWPLQAGGWQFTPKLGALYQHQVLDAFTETVASDSPVASAYGVTGARSTYDTLQPYALVTLAHAFQMRGVRYLPQIEVGYRHDLRDGVPTVMATAADGTVFALPGTTMGRGMATVGARVTAEAGRTWRLFLDYQGQFARHLHDNAVSMGFTRRF